MEINDKFGDLFYRNADASLVLNLLYDIAEHLGHSQEDPISLYFVCLYLGMHIDACDNIYEEIFQIFKNGDKEKLSDYKYVKKIMIKYFPAAKKFNELSVKAYMKGLAKSRLPELITIIE